jgi:hypothetical protein
MLSYAECDRVALWRSRMGKKKTRAVSREAAEATVKTLLRWAGDAGTRAEFQR